MLSPPSSDRVWTSDLCFWRALTLSDTLKPVALSSCKRIFHSESRYQPRSGCIVSQNGAWNCRYIDEMLGDLMCSTGITITKHPTVHLRANNEGAFESVVLTLDIRPIQPDHGFSFLNISEGLSFKKCITSDVSLFSECISCRMLF